MDLLPFLFTEGRSQNRRQENGNDAEGRKKNMKLYVYLEHGTGNIELFPRQIPINVKGSALGSAFLGTIQVEPASGQHFNARELALRLHESIFPDQRVIEASFIDKVAKIIDDARTEVPNPVAPKTATLTLAGMDDLIRQISKLSQLAQRFEDGIREFWEKVPPKTPTPKKTVTKEAERRNRQGFTDGWSEYRFSIPPNAKNIHCTYEVEE